MTDDERFTRNERAEWKGEVGLTDTIVICFSIRPLGAPIRRPR